MLLDWLSLTSLLRLLGTGLSVCVCREEPEAEAKTDAEADGSGPDSDARVLSGECADEPLLRARSRSRSGAGDAEAGVASELDEAYPDRLSLLSGVVGAPAEAATPSPVYFLNMCRREILPRRRPGVDDVEADAAAVPDGPSASVPADRGLRDDEKEGRPVDLL